jgi:hypothetical protein
VVCRCCAQVAWLAATFPLPGDDSNNYRKDGDSGSDTNDGGGGDTDGLASWWRLAFFGRVPALLPGFGAGQPPAQPPAALPAPHLGLAARAALVAALGAALSAPAKAHGLRFLLRATHLAAAETHRPDDDDGGGDGGGVLSGDARGLAAVGVDWLAWCVPRDEASPWPRDWGALKPLDDEVAPGEATASLRDASAGRGVDVALEWVLALAPPFDTPGGRVGNDAASALASAEKSKGGANGSGAAGRAAAWEARSSVVVRAAMGRVVLGATVGGSASRMARAVAGLASAGDVRLDDDDDGA